MKSFTPSKMPRFTEVITDSAENFIKGRVLIKKQKPHGCGSRWFAKFGKVLTCAKCGGIKREKV